VRIPKKLLSIVSLLTWLCYSPKKRRKVTKSLNNLLKESIKRRIKQIKLPKVVKLRHQLKIKLIRWKVKIT